MAMKALKGILSYKARFIKVFDDIYALCVPRCNLVLIKLHISWLLMHLLDRILKISNKTST